LIIKIIEVYPVSISYVFDALSVFTSDMAQLAHSRLYGRDTKSMVILCGRLVQIFQHKFEEYIPTASQILNHFIELQSKLLSLYESNTHLYLSELIAALFRTINLFINWLVLFRNWLRENKTDQIDTIDSLIVYIINMCIASIHRQVCLLIIK
jgi:hypothetical protein